jgi:hypothetical protein
MQHFVLARGHVHLLDFVNAALNIVVSVSDLRAIRRPRKFVSRIRIGRENAPVHSIAVHDLNAVGFMARKSDLLSVRRPDGPLRIKIGVRNGNDFLNLNLFRLRQRDDGKRLRFFRTEKCDGQQAGRAEDKSDPRAGIIRFVHETQLRTSNGWAQCGQK